MLLSKDGSDLVLPVESPFPLAAEDADGELRPIDLSLENRGAVLEPANPVVPVQIARRARSSLRFPALGLTIGLDMDEVSLTDVLSDRAYFANAAADTDYVVAAAGPGAELEFVLRSPASPSQLPLSFEMPADATLQLDGASGAAAVVDDDGTLATVDPPIAFDADHYPVPTSYAIADGRLIVKIDHRDRDVRYPILVDPIARDQRNTDYDVWSEDGSGIGARGWTTVSTRNDGSFSQSLGVGWFGAGLYNLAYGNRSYNSDFAEWHKHPYRSGIYFPRVDFQTSLSPGSWDTNLGWWGTCTELGIWGPTDWIGPSRIDHCNAAYDGHVDTQWAGGSVNDQDRWQYGTPGADAVFKLFMYGQYWRSSDAFNALKFVAIANWDRDAPSVNGLSSFGTRPWAEADSATITGAADDGQGIGLTSVRATAPSQSAWAGRSATNTACDGTSYKPCPLQLPTTTSTPNAGPWTISTTEAGLAGVQGNIPIDVSATEQIGRTSPTKRVGTFQIDRSSPSITQTNGTLYAPNTWLKEGSYDLRARSEDAYSGVKSGTISMFPSMTGRDVFGRTVANGWGAAETGGNWNIAAGNASAFSVGNGEGRITVPAGATTANVIDLPDQVMTDSDAIVDVRFPSAVPATGSTYPYIVMRRSSAGSYRVLLARDNAGRIYIRTEGTSSTLGSVLTGMTYKAGEIYRMRARITGTNPTTIKGKVWRTTDPEPSGWTITSTDSTSGPQASGTNALRLYHTTPVEQTLGYDNFSVTALGAARDRDKKLNTYADGTTPPANSDGSPGQCNTTRGCATALDHAWTWTTSGELEGPHTFYVNAQDPLNHNAPQQQFTVNLDRTPPTVPSVSGALSVANSWNGYDTRNQLHAQATDQTAGISRLELVVDGQVVDSSDAPCSPSCPPAFEDDLKWDNTSAANTHHTVKVRAIDAAKNPAETSSWEVRTDLDEPEYDISGSLVERGGHPLNASSYELTVDATDQADDGPRSGVSVISATVDGNAFGTTPQTCAPTADSCPLADTYTLDPGSLSVGRHEVSFSVEDRAGNQTTDQWYVGIDEPTPPQPTLSQDSNSRSLLRVDGANAGDGAGSAVDGIGDINGDGYSDYAIGAPTADPGGRTDAGTVYVVYGRAGGAPVDLRNFDQTQGFRITGAAAGDGAGTGVASVGDVNGDELADLAVGAPRNLGGAINGTRRGAVYVVFGRDATTDIPLPDIDLATLGTGGFSIIGPPPPALQLPIGTRPPKPFGAVIAAGSGSLYDVGIQYPRGGDVNGDGYDDIVLGSSAESNNARAQSGSAYVIFGKTSTASITVDQLGAAGARIDGAGLADLAGYSVASLGDLNDDDYADIAVGAPGADAGTRLDAGAGYVLYGGPSFGTRDLAQPGTSQYRITGANGDQLGTSLSALDDFSNDGVPDIALGGHAAYVAFGHRDQAQDVDASFSSDTTGVRLTGDGADLLVGEAGDADRDGSPDLQVGMPNPSAGRGWLVYGGITATTDLTTLGAHLGTIITATPEDRALGAATAAGGAATGRNASDQLIAAPAANRNSRTGSGSVYVMPGVERPSCLTGYTPTAEDEGALATCVEGDDVVAVDRDHDGSPEKVVDTSETSSATFAAASKRGNERNYDNHDTGVTGEIVNDHEWVMRRTGVTAEVGSKSKTIGTVRISARLRLEGNIARFKEGRVFVERHTYKVKPRFYAVCQERRRDNQYRDGCNGRDINVFKETQKYYFGGGGVHFVNEERSMYGAGSFRWIFNISGNMVRAGIESVSWSPPPQIRSKKYYCKHNNLACQFYRGHG
jgi:hypothetical protein